MAGELERILKDRPPGKTVPSPGTLQRLPTSRRDSAPLMQEIPVDKLRHHMVLPDRVEKRFHRIAKEFAARTRLAKHGLRPRHRILLYGPPGFGEILISVRQNGLNRLQLREDDTATGVADISTIQRIEPFRAEDAMKMTAQGQ